MEHLKTRITRLGDYYNRYSMLVLTWAVAAILLIGYFVEPQDPKLLVVFSYLIAGLGGILMARVPASDRLTQAAYLLPGLATAFGLLIFATEGIWEWWMALAGVAALFTLAPGTRPDVQAVQTCVLLVLFATVVGVLLADPDSVDRDDLFLGLGIVIVGQAVALLHHSGSIPERQVTVTSSSGVARGGNGAMSIDDVMDLSMRIHVTADGLVRAVQAINDVISQQSSGANEQVDVIKLTNNMMDTFLKSSEQISGQAHAMTLTADETAGISKEGQTAITQAIQGMDQIRSQVSNIGMTIVTLAQLTKRIDEIITSVTEIATQSNLLALNASIEAARAGVHGRGFAVVADEVRSLSQQSTNAATQVRAILAEIQSAVRQTINATEIGMQGVDAGVSMTQQADRIMVQLTKNVTDSTEAVRAIYDVIRQQGEGLEEIAISMDRIDRITQQNLTSTKMVSTVLTNLTRLADDLQDVVKLGEAHEIPDPPALDPSEVVEDNEEVDGPPEGY